MQASQSKVQATIRFQNQRGLTKSLKQGINVDKALPNRSLKAKAKNVLKGQTSTTLLSLAS